MIEFAISRLDNSSKIQKGDIYRYYGMSRQAFRKGVLKLEQERRMMELIAEEVSRHRNTKDRRAGSRTLYYNLEIGSRYSIGVSKFEELMSEYRLILSVVKTRLITTRSTALSRKYRDLIKGLIINNINQVIVGDLTYIYIDNRVYYLFSLFDYYSGRMVGCHGSDRMRKQEAMEALEQFIRLRGVKRIQKTIHHTDGGSQYFSHAYLKKGKMMAFSVAENCLANGYAEQRNGLIKAHFLPLINGESLKSFQQGVQYIKDEYNNRRQEKLGWLSPIEFEEKWQKVPEEKRPKKQIYNYEESN